MERMDALINYMFPRTSRVDAEPVPPKPNDVSVYITVNNTVNIFKLSAVKDLSLKELREWFDVISCHVGSSFDTEEVNNGNTILEAIEMRIKSLTT